MVVVEMVWPLSVTAIVNPHDLYARPLFNMPADCRSSLMINDDFLESTHVVDSDTL